MFVFEVCRPAEGGGAGPRAPDKIGAWPRPPISFDLVREMKDAYNHRLQLVQYARQHGIKPTARAFATTAPTVAEMMSSSIWKPSPVAVNSSPRRGPISSTSTSRDRIRTKKSQTPWQIIEQLAPRSPLQLCLLPPVFLDYYLTDAGGYDVPSYP